MATITIVSQGTLGDHFPFLALGESLVARGHKARYLGPPHLAEAIAECGMEAWPFRCEVDPDNVKGRPEAFDHWSRERGGTGPIPDRENWDLYVRSGFEDKLEDVLAATSGSDLLVCSRLVTVGRTASELARVPWVSVCVIPWFYPSPGTAAEKGMAEREDPEAFPPSLADFVDKVNAHREWRGLQPLKGARARELFEAPRILLATSPLFGQPKSIPGREIVQTGFWLHTPPRWRQQGLPAEAISWLEARPEPPMVLSFSSQPVRDPAGLLDMHLLAARMTGLRLVVQGGWAEWNSPAFANACADGQALHLPAGPQDELFKRAAVVVHHGGIGTTARATLAAAPQLVEPHGNDQFYNARQVKALGLGAAANPHRPNVDGLVSLLRREILTEQTKTTALKLADLMASELGVKEAIRQLERWLEVG